MRKILAPAFSERALQTQEHILQEYTDLLISRFRDQIKSAGQSPITVNLDKWYSFTTFDTIGDLCFGESFSCLERSEQHPWVESIFPGIKFGMILTLFDHFGARNYVRYLLPKSVHYKADQHAEFCRRKIDQRMRSQIERPDFISYILNQSEKNGITKDELESTAVFLLLAGSETSATTLAAATWFILKNAEVLQRVQREIRNAFSSAEDITVGIMHKLPFLHAVLQESLRLHPVSPVAVPREVDRPGTVVCGHEIPIGVSEPFFSFLLFFEKMEEAEKKYLLDPRGHSTKGRLPTSSEFRRAALLSSRALAPRCRRQIRSRSERYF